MISRGIVVSIMFVALASGCTSDREANRSNFKQAIDEHFTRECILVRPGGGDESVDGFPVTIRLEPSDRDVARELNVQATHEFDALVAIGLLSVESKSVKSSALRLGNESKSLESAKIYSLTTDGEKNYQKAGKNRSSGFCIGYYRVDEIKRFTEPGTDGPYTMSEVAFTYSPHDVPDWAAKADGGVLPDVADALQQSQDGKAVLILTNQGWVHEQDFHE